MADTPSKRRSTGDDREQILTLLSADVGERVEKVKANLKADIDERFSQYERTIKVLMGAAGIFATILVALLGAVLASGTVRSALFSAYIVDIDKKLASYMATNAEKIVNVDEKLEKFLSKAVAYSYYIHAFLGTESGYKPFYKFSFYKSDGDEGRLNCTAEYPNDVKNPIALVLNGREMSEKDHGWQLAPDRSSAATVVGDRFLIQAKNQKLFPDGRQPSPLHTLVFRVNDSPAFKHPISLRCTLLVLGSAKYRSED